MTGVEPQNLRELPIPILPPDLEDPPLFTPPTQEGGDQRQKRPAAKQAAGHPLGGFLRRGFHAELWGPWGL